MPEISRFYGIIIAMYFLEHNPPHFRARYEGESIAVEIRSLRIMEGQFPPRVLNLVMEWDSQHQAELLHDWNLACNNQPPEKIEPLR